MLEVFSKYNLVKFSNSILDTSLIYYFGLKISTLIMMIKDHDVLKSDSSDSCTTLWIYLKTTELYTWKGWILYELTPQREKNSNACKVLGRHLGYNKLSL